MREYYIYLYFRLDTNEIFYVGKGKGERCFNLWGRSQHFLNIVNKVPTAVVKVIEGLTEEESLGIECWIINHLIEEYGYSMDNDWCRSTEKGRHLANITFGGEGVSAPCSDEHKRKIGLANTGANSGARNYNKSNDYYIFEEPELPEDKVLMDWYDELALKGDTDTLFRALYPYICSCTGGKDEFISNLAEVFVKAVKSYTVENGHFRDYFSLKIFSCKSREDRDFCRYRAEFNRNLIYTDRYQSTCKNATESIELAETINNILSNSKFKDYQKEIYIKTTFQGYTQAETGKDYNFSKCYVWRMQDKINNYVKIRLIDLGYSY